MRHDYSLSSFPGKKTKAQKFQISFAPNSSVIELRYQPVSAWRKSSKISTYCGVAKCQLSVKLNSSMAYIFFLENYHLRKYYLLKIFCYLIENPYLMLTSNKKRAVFWLLSLLPTSYFLCPLLVGSYKIANTQFLDKDKVF